MLHEIKRFTSKRGKSVVIVYQNTQHLSYHVCIIPGRFPSWSDWSVKNPDGSISYDRPEIIAKHARTLVKLAYTFIEESQNE
jgi:hypothetical protein